MRPYVWFVLTAALLLLASGCTMNHGENSGPQGIDLFPIYRHINDPSTDMSETSVLWPIFRSADIRGRKELRLFPLFSLHSGLTGPRAIQSFSDWLNSVALFSRNSLRDGSETIYAVGAPYLLSYRNAVDNRSMRSHRVHIAPLYPPFTARPTVEIAANAAGDFSYSFLTLYCARRGEMHGAGLFPLFGIWSRGERESGWYALAHLLADWTTETDAYDFFFPLVDVDRNTPPNAQKGMWRRTFVGPFLASKHTGPDGHMLYRRFMIMPVVDIWKDFQWDACAVSLWPLVSVGAVGDTWCWELIGPVFSGYGRLHPNKETPTEE